MPLAENLSQTPKELSDLGVRARPHKELGERLESPLTLSLNDTVMVTLSDTPHEIKALALGHPFCAGRIDHAGAIRPLHFMRSENGLSFELVNGPKSPSEKQDGHAAKPHYRPAEPSRV